MKLRLALVTIAATAALGAVATPNAQAQMPGTAGEEIQVPFQRAGVAGVPNYYIVRPGDTLMAICEAYFRNPYEWPRVWSFNPHITNPHWIYPGDVVFLRPPADPSTDARGGPVRRPPGRPGTHFPLAGFYTGTELDTLGFIRFSPAPYRNLTLFDEVYMEFDDPRSIRLGERFALNRVLDRIYDDDDELAGVKYQVTGVVEVVEVYEDSPLILGRIVQAWDTIERGDVLFANQRQIRVVERRPSDRTLEAQIVDFFEPTVYAAESFYLFIDAGFNQGVREGNVFTIWDRYDEYTELADGEPGFEEEEHIEDMPWRPMGEAMVIFTGNDYSTVVVLGSDLELSRGMRVTITEGL